MALWSAPFIVMAIVAFVMGTGVIGNANPAKAFAWSGVLVTVAVVLLVVGLFYRPNAQRRAVGFHQISQGPGFFSKAFSAIGKACGYAGSWMGTKLVQLGSLTGRAANNNPTAAASVVAWVVMVLCLVWLAQADRHFWPAVALLLAFHAAVGFSLAWGGKWETVFQKTLENVSVLWVYSSLVAMVLTAIYGHESGYAWWTFQPFVLATLSFTLALLNVFGLLRVMLEAGIKLLTGGYGAAPAAFALGLILVVGGMYAFHAAGRDFLDFEFASLAKDPILIAIGLGFLAIVVFVPVALLLKIKS